MRKNFLLLLSTFLLLASCSVNPKPSDESGFSSENSSLPSSGQISETTSEEETTSERSSESSEVNTSEDSATNSSESSSSEEPQFMNSISDIYALIKAAPLDDKGNSEYQYVAFVAQYVAQISASSMGLFSDGNDVIQVYGEKSFYKSGVGNYYTVYGYATTFKYKPSVNLLKMEFKPSDSHELDLPASEVATVSSLKKNKRETLDIFNQVYHFEGYLDFKTWSNNDKYVLIDNIGDNLHDPNTKSSDALYIDNHDEDLYDEDWVLADYYKAKISVDFVVLQYNTAFFTWQIFIFDETINLAE